MTLIGNGMKMAEQGLEWLKTISTQLDTQNVMLQALVAGQQRADRQRMFISDIYIEAGEQPSRERIAAEVARLQHKRED